MRRGVLGVRGGRCGRMLDLGLGLWGFWLLVVVLRRVVRDVPPLLVMGM